MSEEPLPATIVEAAERLRARQLSPVDLATDMLARAEALQPRLDLFIRITRDRLLEGARRAEAEIAAAPVRSPLHGVPVTLKDLIDVAGEVTTAGGRILPDTPATEDATVWARLREGGATLLGKTNLQEFAFGPTNINPHYGTARNPWNRDRITGGSSGGSAAAVAAGIGLGSIGSDTGGSIRCPAALCGVTGLKPTFGRVPRTGVFPLSDSQDHVGPIARTALDCALLLDLIAGPDGRDASVIERRPPRAYEALVAESAEVGYPGVSSPRARPLAGVRLGVVRTHLELVQPVVRDACDEAAGELERLGAQLVEVDLAGEEELTQASMTIVRFDGTRLHAGWFRERPEAYGADLRIAFERILARPDSDYEEAIRVRGRLSAEILTRQSDCDGLIGPTMPDPAPPISDFSDPQRAADARARLLRLTYLYNATGQPAITVPCGFTPDGLPIGLQIAAAPWREVDCLRIAHAYQQVTDWHLRRPTISA